MLFGRPLRIVDEEGRNSYQRCGVFNRTYDVRARRAAIGKLIAEGILKADKDDPRLPPEGRNRQSRGVAAFPKMRIASSPRNLTR